LGIILQKTARQTYSRRRSK